MSNSTPQTPVLQAARIGNVAYLRVTGRATFSVGPALKQFRTASIRAGCVRIVMDAHHCENMDSTFLGILAGLAGRLARETGGGIRMLNVNERLFDVVHTLGIDQLLECRKLGAQPEPLVEPPDLLKPVAATASDAAGDRQLIIEAHAKLASMSEENKLRFQDVLTYLREQQEDSTPK